MGDTIKRKIYWKEYEQLVNQLANKVSHKSYDLIIGVCRGGLPVAVNLSHDIGCRNMGIVIAKKTVSDNIFEFDHRTELYVSDYILPEDKPKSILIVDDIVAYGDLFSSILSILEKRYGIIESITLATLFADVQQIKQSPYSLILDNLYYSENVDNKSSWIVFPWEN